jgi:hypothetical protein
MVVCVCFALNVLGALLGNNHLSDGERIGLVALSYFVIVGGVLGVCWTVGRLKRGRRPMDRAMSYYAHLNGSVIGPFTWRQMRAMHKERVILPDTLCAMEGSEVWRPFKFL